MKSFYGGKGGESFNLVKSYSSYEELYNDMTSSGSSINYGEYAIITNVNSNDNNKVYRKDYNGPVYIFTLTIPVTENSFSLDDYATVEGTEGAKTYDLTINNGGLIPGSQENNTIKIAEVTKNNVTTIGLKIPYLTLDFDICYCEDDEEPSTERTEYGPFYQKWTLHLPIKNGTDGDKGDSYSDLKLDSYRGEVNLVCKKITYEGGEPTETNVVIGKYTTINEITFSEEDILKIKTNQNDTIEKELIYPKNIELIETDEDSKLKVKFKDPDYDKEIPFNYIRDTRIFRDSENNSTQFQILFSSEQYREDLDQKGKLREDGWFNCGEIGSHVELIGGDITDIVKTSDGYSQGINGPSDVITVLNRELATGLSGEAKGKLVTYAAEDRTNWLFGFDYRVSLWRYYGAINLDLNTVPTVFVDDEETFVDELAVGGIACLLEEF